MSLWSFGFTRYGTQSLTGLALINVVVNEHGPSMLAVTFALTGDNDVHANIAKQICTSAESRSVFWL